MTPSEIEMLVATEVMGLTVPDLPDSWPGRGYHEGEWEIAPVAGGGMRWKAPDYARDIWHAWRVVEEMVKRGKVFIVKGDGLRTGDHNPAWTVLCDGVERTDAHSAERAICIAALKCYGIEVPKP